MGYLEMKLDKLTNSDLIDKYDKKYTKAQADEKRLQQPTPGAASIEKAMEQRCDTASKGTG